jgi:multidrug resistance efflux pump
VTGVVLRIVQDSEAVVQAGAPLLEIGDPRDLEVVADLLSTDAVQIKPGSPVRVDGWGGSPIEGRVTGRPRRLHEGVGPRHRGVRFAQSSISPTLGVLVPAAVIA